jgi:hypothetical protein
MIPAELVIERDGRIPLAAASARRNKAPVFVLGCGRSGTKLLFHMLMSSGGFAVYESESNAFNLLGSRFGNLKHKKNRQRLMQTWLQTKLFQRSGLTREEIEPPILEQCRSAGDFLSILMETIARKQGVERWVEATPLHLLYLPEIKRLIPNALIVHIIRDGRDTAVSLNKVGWIRPFPWDRERSILAAGLFWKWIVRRGRSDGQKFGADYLEIHYEDLISQPRESLQRLGAFIGHDLDYDSIVKVGIGSVSKPNSSFRDSARQKEFNPVGRWKTVLSPAQVAQLESGIGDLLEELHYPLSGPLREPKPAERLMTTLYPASFSVKTWLKSRTPLGRFADTGRMGKLSPQS